MRRFLAGAGAGIVAAALIFVAVLYLADLEIAGRDSGEPAGIVVPDLVGEDPDDASAEIEALGLEANVESPISDGNVPIFEDPDPLTVVEQIPPAGTEVPADATVTLTAD